MKRNTRLFFRSFYVSSVVVFCMSLGFFGITKAYEGIRLVGFGEYRKAIEIGDSSIKIFDYIIEF